MEKDGVCKMDRQNKKKCSCAKKNGRRKNNAGTDKEGEKNWLGQWLRKDCLLKDTLEGMVNGKKIRGRRRYPMIIVLIIDLLLANQRYDTIHN